MTAIPKLYAQERVKDPIICEHWTHPRSSWEWFILEYDPDERLFFAFVRGFDDELGCVSRDELEQAGCVLDPHWTPRKLSSIR